MTQIPEKSASWRSQTAQDYAHIGAVIQSHLNSLNDGLLKVRNFLIWVYFQ